MSTDSIEQITTTLDEVAAHAAVPPIDEVGFQRRVTGLRRRRRAGVAAAVAAAVAVPAVGLPVVRSLADSVDDSGREPVGGAAAAAPTATDLGTVAFAVEGRLLLQSPDRYGGGADATDVRVEEPIVVRDDDVLVTGPDSEHLLVPLDGGEPVAVPGMGRAQWVDGTSDGSLAWIGLDDRFHVWLAGQRAVDVGGVEDPDQRVYDVEGFRWVWGEGEWLSLGVTGGEGRRIDVGGRHPMDADLSGDRVAVVTDEGTLFADATSGEALTGPVGGETGALSADGRWWVSNPAKAETAEGMTRGLWAWDTTTGKAEEFAGFDDTGHVSDVVWQRDRALVVVETNAGEVPIRTLYSCDVDSLTCAYHYEDESGTLQLPRG